MRKDVWRFLLGYHAYTTTKRHGGADACISEQPRERSVIDYQRRIEYAALKQRWQELLEPESVRNAMSGGWMGVKAAERRTVAEHAGGRRPVPVRVHPGHHDRRTPRH